MPKLTWSRATRWFLPAILVVYAVLASLYAALTPAWQAPDEPAHYNYVRFLSEQSRFPILKMGDYPAAYLEEIKSAHFPPEMSIAPIRYEFHQPPLYYLLAMPIYSLFKGALLPLRILSVLIGAFFLLVVFWTVQELAPDHPFLAVASTTFAAFLPMHLAMSAAVNNDGLTELLLALILLLSIRYLKLTHADDLKAEVRLLLVLGVTTGLGLVTKSAIYISPLIVLCAIALRHLWIAGRDVSLRRWLASSSLYILPAIAMALPWWLRNVALYGGFDFLGLERHDQVVAGQLRTAQFVAERGLVQLFQDLGVTSFRSFWGQFGWMGVLLDSRIYQTLAILSALALAGLAGWGLGIWRRRRRLPKWQWAAGGLLVLLGLLTWASYLWYNAQFVQHQGRYLFRALVPISLAFALGWRQMLDRDWAVPVAVGLLAAAAILRLFGLLSGWPFLLLVLAAVAFSLRRVLPRSWDPVIQACPYLLLIPLNLAALLFFIVPQLAV